MLRITRRHDRAVAAADHQPSPDRRDLFQASSRRPGRGPLTEACRGRGRRLSRARPSIVQGRVLHPFGAVAAMLHPALRQRPGRTLHGCRILPRRHLGRRIGIGRAAIAIRSMKDDAGLSVLAIGTCCASAGVAAATKSRASRIFCIGSSRSRVLQANTVMAGQPAGFPLSAAAGCCYSHPRNAQARRGQGKHEQTTPRLPYWSCCLPSWRSCSAFMGCWCGAAVTWP